MRLVFGLVLIAGLGLAGFAVYMVRGYFDQMETALAQERAARAAQVPLTEIYVATKPLRYGDRLTPEDVKLIKFPADSMPEGAFSDPAILFPDNNREPRHVLRAIEPNEPLLAVKITRPGDEAGVAALLSAGMRAFAINVDVSSGVSGFLNPGDRVDVYWSGSINGQGITQLIDTNVLIIAVDQTADQDRNNPILARTITVEATPEQVAALAQAQATGRLTLSLVGRREDAAISGEIKVDQRKLLGIEERVEAPQAAPARVCTIKTRRAGELVEIPIPCTN